MHAIPTWVLVADASHARAYQSRRPGDALERVADFTFDEAVPHARELRGHRPGSGHGGVGSAHHSVGPTSDPRREMKHHFAKRVADALEAARRQGAFKRLIVACPPAMLGDLRAELAPAVKSLVVAEVAKDLVKTPDAELLAHFDGIPALTRHP